jgi:hypothetical protein
MFLIAKPAASAKSPPAAKSVVNRMPRMWRAISSPTRSTNAPTTFEDDCTSTFSCAPAPRFSKCRTVNRRATCAAHSVGRAIAATTSTLPTVVSVDSTVKSVVCSNSPSLPAAFRKLMTDRGRGGRVPEPLRGLGSPRAPGSRGVRGV